MTKKGRKAPRVSGRALTPTMRRWIAAFGEIPHFRAIAKRVGCHEVEIGYVFREQRSTRHIQEAVARVAGMSVEALFGDAAWHKRAAEFLQRRLDRRRVSA